MREGKPGGGKGPLPFVDHSGTLATGNDQLLFQPYEYEWRVRKLTPVECERLQGFPDGWTEGFADTVRYRMLGNAVAVPVAEWILLRMLEVDGA
jgi:site-specific DNA-cytosine methylase